MLTVFPSDYLEKCLNTSLRTNSENVGGVLETLPGGDGIGAKMSRIFHQIGLE